MSQQAKTELSNEESNRGVCWYPLRKWWQSSRLFNQDLGLPPFLEPGDPRWRDVDWLQRSLAACSWPGYIPPPLFVPYISASMHHSGQKISEEQYKWRVNLEVAHFFPSDIFVSVSDGFLEVELEATGEEQEKEEAPDTDPGSCRAPEAPCLPSAEDDGEESPLEVHGDQAHTGSNTAGLEERRDQEEETLEKPAGESHPSAPVDGEGTENFQVSSEHNEAQEILEIPDTEHQEPAVDGEIQPGSGETTDEITHPEEQELGKSPPNDALSQELEVPDIKQEN
ncbi:hypothetical protein F7725_013165 [Dissostichus mawsoni]|uniref:Uncharacterized protein n=1 Tax=Dissostichus mawsoni TaxID=36200 RepID=A0A7J5YQK3_DISMA|nr:hypothetical protein F7725_013165 [Dissostichus mawsoni]